jgi:hypothetical protein
VLAARLTSIAAIAAIAAIVTASVAPLSAQAPAR